MLICPPLGIVDPGHTVLALSVQPHTHTHTHTHTTRAVSLPVEGSDLQPVTHCLLRFLLLFSLFLSLSLSLSLSHACTQLSMFSAELTHRWEFSTKRACHRLTACQRAQLSHRLPHVHQCIFVWQTMTDKGENANLFFHHSTGERMKIKSEPHHCWSSDHSQSYKHRHMRHAWNSHMVLKHSFLICV